ncbi:O-antigen ligase family protein [Streptomyces sp. NPDC101165]|uniref:O-antigen ligase family protein n=1 Tax=Streptomyces sp. NPDC101165 TaxID=3366119 RepID=UPI00380A84A9
MIAGVLVVAVLLTGGRWISHVPVGPLYISDVLMFAAFAQVACSSLLSPKRTGRTYGPGILVGLLLVMTAFRLLATRADVWTAARDAAPFAYAVISYLSASAYQRAGDHSRARTVRLLHGGLLLHFGWLTVATFAPGFATAMPQVDASSRVMEIRTDFDVALLGVLAGVSILRMRGGRTWLHATMAAAALVPALALPSRAGILACGACVLVALLLRSARHGRINVRVVLATAAAVLALAAVLPFTPGGQRLLATDGSATASSDVVAGAVGTKQARMTAWDRVMTYTLDDSVRTSVGVGFGPNFMEQSHADIPLRGRGEDKADGLRSPHNYLLTAFARLGLAGLTVVASLLAVLGSVVIRTVRRGPPDELTSVSVLLVIALCTAALLGVVLEAPFGAIPFFWAVGILIAGDRSRRARLRQKPERKAPPAVVRTPTGTGPGVSALPKTEIAGQLSSV